MALTSEQYAYLAGLIDGDGCVALRWRLDPKCKTGRTACPQLIVVSKDMWFLEKLKTVYGGRLNRQGKCNFSDGSQVWSLRFSPNEMRELLPHLIPHFVLKQEEAKLLLEGINITVRHRFKDYDPSGLDGIIESIKTLKKERMVVV